MVFMDLFSLLEYCRPLLFTMAFAWLMGLFSNLILPFYQLGFLFLPTQFSLFANSDLHFHLLGSPSSPPGSVDFFILYSKYLEHILSFTKTVGHCYQGFSLVLSAWF